MAGQSPRTLEAYELAVRALLAYLRKMGLRISPVEVTTEHIRMFLASLTDQAMPATINQRYRSLHRFFAWQRKDTPGTRHYSACQVNLLRSLRQLDTPSPKDRRQDSIRFAALGLRALAASMAVAHL